MDNQNIPVTQRELLYDPMFAKKPDSILEDDPTKGFFGKIAVKKASFVIVLFLFILLSMYFSFRTVSKDLYTFDRSVSFSDDSSAYMLSEYHGDSRQVLIIDYVRSEKDEPDTSKIVREVGRYAVNCNEALSFIYISDKVEVIDPKAFYTCKNLKAIFVDENNQNYKSVDGVLYRCENGIPVEIMMFPAKNPEYKASLEMGLNVPATPEDTEDYFSRYSFLEAEIPSVSSGKNRLQSVTEEKTSSFIIPNTVTVINELCFAECYSLRYVTIPDGVTDIETLAFFKCMNLQELSIPGTVISIGSDAFSYCRSIKDIFIPSSVKAIGHHAFYDCSSVSVVRMECSEEEAKQMELGSAWLPEKRKVVMRPIGVSYNEEREVS